MKNIKVFVEVKKICTIFYVRKHLLPLFSCLFTGGREIEFLRCFLMKLAYFFYLVMVDLGWGRLTLPRLWAWEQTCLPTHKNGEHRNRSTHYLA